MKIRLEEGNAYAGRGYGVVWAPGQAPTFDYFRSLVPQQKALTKDLLAELKHDRAIMGYGRLSDLRTILGHKLPRLFWKTHNKTPTVGLTHISKLIGGLSSDSLGFMAIGSNDTAPNASDTALNTQTDRVPVNQRYLSGAVLKADTFFPDGSPAQAANVKEGGLFTLISGGTMLNRGLFSPAITTFIAGTTLTTSMSYTGSSAN